MKYILSFCFLLFAHIAMCNMVQASEPESAQENHSITLDVLLETQSLRELRTLGVKFNKEDKESAQILVSHGEGTWLADIRLDAGSSDKISIIDFILPKTDDTFFSIVRVLSMLNYRPLFSEFFISEISHEPQSIAFWKRSDNAQEDHDYYTRALYSSIFASMTGHMQTVLVRASDFATAQKDKPSSAMPVFILNANSPAKVQLSFTQNSKEIMEKTLKAAKNSKEKLPFPLKDMKQAYADATENKSIPDERKPTDIILFPKDADLARARDAIIEPSHEPYNIGGWLSRGTITFPIQIAEAGIYSINLLYSKQAFDGSTADLLVHVANDTHADTETACRAFLPATGSNWATYHEIRVGSVELVKGKNYLIFSDAAHNKRQYVMNLREVRLVKK